MTMQKRANRARLDGLVGKAWAWKIQDEKGRWVMCNWACPTRQGLDEDGKPSTEARALRVHIIPAND